MITADTSTWVAFLDGSSGEDTLLLEKALQDRQLVMVPDVLTELLSDPKLPPAVAATLSDVPLLQIESGFWQRAGALRAKVLTKRRKARLADALIAQICIDASVSLIARDRDFRAFAQSAGLRLLPASRPHGSSDLKRLPLPPR
jgi:predicted nucleic acid-binding protein